MKKKNCIGISDFGYENQEKHPIYVARNCSEEEHVYLLLIEEKGRRHCPYHTFQLNSCIIILYTVEKTMPEKSEHVKFKNYERKLKSPFIIYAEFESILVSKDNGKQIQGEPYTNKYQKHIACSFCYK